MNIPAERYAQYRHTSVNNRFVKHDDLVDILASYEANPLFTIRTVGHSFEGRTLNLITTGSGEAKVFIWSQMHGDESTATMAIFDLLNFFAATDDLDDLRGHILKNCTLYILPMVNPDGAEVFTRRNAQGIDINRDFNRQQTPEGRLLRSLRDEIEPHFGFNMHDQSTLWSAGFSGNPATISLLAPAYDEQLSINPVRENAMKVLSFIKTELQNHIPGFVARFDDEHEPRAFGDNFQNAGTSTILIEAGGFPNDPEKQYIRKLTFFALMSGLQSIAGKSYLSGDVRGYNAIPDNVKRHFHLLLKNCQVESPNGSYNVDIGLVSEEILNPDQRSVTYTYMIDDTGDLSGFYGYEEVDASAFKLILTRPLVIDEKADFILQDQFDTVLCIENGCITNKNL